MDGGRFFRALSVVAMVSMLAPPLVAANRRMPRRGNAAGEAARPPGPRMVAVRVLG